jgi:hypothetical protein
VVRQLLAQGLLAVEDDYGTLVPGQELASRGGLRVPALALAFAARAAAPGYTEPAMRDHMLVWRIQHGRSQPGVGARCAR